MQRTGGIRTIVLAALLALGGLLTSHVPGYAAATLSLSRQTAAAGYRLTATGSGYTRGDSVVVFADFSIGGSTSRSQVVARAGTNGTFIAGFTVPQAVTPGIYRVTAQDTHGHSATAPLTILPLAILRVGAKPPTVTVVAQHFFYAMGSGFGAGERVGLTVSFPLYNGNSVAVSKAATADQHGNFGEVSIQVPADAKAGAVTLAAKGQSSGKIATATIRVVYRPVIALNPSTLRPSGTFTVTGTGFVPTSTVRVAVSIPRHNASTITLSKDVTTGDGGGFSTAFTLPLKTSSGTYRVGATDAAHGLQAHADLTVTLKPIIAVLPSSVHPGQAVAVSGSGFSAIASVTVTAIIPLYGGGTTPITETVTTNASGDFSTHIAIPGHTAAGVLTITATGPNGGAKVFLIVQRVLARVSVAPAPARPGSNIKVTGSGYPAGDKVILTMAVKLTDGTTKTLTAAVTADSHGNFIGLVTIPGRAAVGSYTLVATSTSTGRAPSAGVVVAVSARISLRPAAVSPGQSTAVSGQGFGSKVPVTVSAMVPLYGGGSRTLSRTIQTDATGAFTVTLPIPSNAAAGAVTVSARGPNARTAAQLLVGHVTASIILTPSSAIPGGTVTVKGSGYASGDTVQITVPITTTASAKRTQSITAHADARGAFAATLPIPADTAAGTYTVLARSQVTGRAPTASLAVIRITPSIVVAPSPAVPGTAVTVNGFGFAAGAHVTLLLNAKTVGSATAGPAGKFTVKIQLSPNLASGSYTLAAVSHAGRRATTTLSVSRVVSTHFYFASIFTGPGHAEYLAFVNPSTVAARVTITYQRTNGTTTTKTVTVNPTSRFTESANTDLGVKVSAAASVAADVPIGAALVKYEGTDGSTIPGSRAPSMIWYFANGNTSHQYREYLALQNPNRAAVQAVIHLFPTHHPPIALYRNLAPTSRLTIKVNKFVRDAVGVTITSNAPIVANRTIKIQRGVDSKNGVTSPARTWYFAAGPRDPRTRHWIGIVNPSPGRAFVTLRAYGPAGRELGTVSQYMRTGGRAGYLINRITHGPDAAVVITSSRPIVAEQTTYMGTRHYASTDTFGVPLPARSWAYAAADTTNGRGAEDFLDLFNPNLTALPIVVQFLPASGSPVQRTYVVGPLAHRRVDVGSVEPNAELGIAATSDLPFVGLNRNYFHHRLGAMTSPGVRP